MITERELLGEVETLSTIKTMVETYQEVSAWRMRLTRNQVLRSRTFLVEINSIFQEVKSSYRKEIEELIKKKKVKDQKKVSFLRRNGKTLYVLLSANTGLYGDIVDKTFDLFIKKIKIEQADAVVIGKLGLKLYQEKKITAPVSYFDFPDNDVNLLQLKKIASYILQYEKIIVFYGQFQSIITQTAVLSDISGHIIQEERVSAIPKPTPVVAIKYFFEPSLSEILAFFETEIFAFLLERIMRESQLAKFAARVVSLDRAGENIRKKLSLVIFDKRRMDHREANRKQLETFSSISLWGTRK